MRPPGSIGADPCLRRRIETALAELAGAREAHVGYAARCAVAAALKRDFGLAPDQPWTAIWDWPAERAGEIINYLRGRYAETLGRAGFQRSA